MTNTEELPLCECGCGERVAKKGNRFIHNHHLRGKDYDKTQKRQLCKCGCGGLTNPGYDYILGHSRRGKKHLLESLLKMSSSHKKYYEDHPEVIDKMSKQQKENPSRGFLGKRHSQTTIDKISKAKKGKKGMPHTEISKIAISKRLTGKPKSLKHRKKLSKSVKNSEAAKIAADRQRGGNDLVWHHVAYDFANPKSLRVRVKRKFHGQIHSPKGIQRNKRSYSLID